MFRVRLYIEDHKNDIMQYPGTWHNLHIEFTAIHHLKRSRGELKKNGFSVLLNKEAHRTLFRIHL